MNTILKPSSHMTSIQSVLTVNNKVTSLLQLSFTKFDSTKSELLSIPVIRVNAWNHYYLHVMFTGIILVGKSLAYLFLLYLREVWTSCLFHHNIMWHVYRKPELWSHPTLTPSHHNTKVSEHEWWSYHFRAKSKFPVLQFFISRGALLQYM